MSDTWSIANTIKMMQEVVVMVQIFGTLYFRVITDVLLAQLFESNIIHAQPLFPMTFNSPDLMSQSDGMLL